MLNAVEQFVFQPGQLFVESRPFSPQSLGHLGDCVRSHVTAAHDFLLPIREMNHAISQGGQSGLGQFAFLDGFRSEQLHEVVVKMQLVPPLDREEISHFVEGDTASPVKETAGSVELRHLFPEHHAGFLKDVLSIRRIDELPGDECIQGMPMLNQQRDELIGLDAICGLGV